MTFEYILLHDCDEPHCSTASAERRAVHIEWIAYASDYAEPGYTAGKAGVLTGNWNEFSQRAYDLLEKAGYSCEWEDEWTTCEECGKLFRTSGDSYGWTMYGSVDDNGCICGDCIKSDPTAYLETLEDNPRRAITIDGVDPTEHGYTKHNGTFETGWYPGQNDDPREILDALKAEGKTGILFAVAGVGQFDLHFTAWYKESEAA